MEIEQYSLHGIDFKLKFPSIGPRYLSSNGHDIGISINILGKDTALMAIDQRIPTSIEVDPATRSNIFHFEREGKNVFLRTSGDDPRKLAQVTVIDNKEDKEKFWQIQVGEYPEIAIATKEKNGSTRFLKVEGHKISEIRITPLHSQTEEKVLHRFIQIETIYNDPPLPDLGFKQADKLTVSVGDVASGVECFTDEQSHSGLKYLLKRVRRKPLVSSTIFYLKKNKAIDSIDYVFDKDRNCYVAEREMPEFKDFTFVGEVSLLKVLKPGSVNNFVRPKKSPNSGLDDLAKIDVPQNTIVSFDNWKIPRQIFVRHDMVR